MELELNRSYDRCKNNNLPVNLGKPLKKISIEEYKQIIKRDKNLITSFDKTINQLRNNIRGDYFFILTDRKGVLLALDCMYHTDVCKILKSKGIINGISFGEDSLGTNAISLAMSTKKYIFLKPEQHYCEILKKWYCFATPLIINDQLIGYIDVSTIDEKIENELMVITELLSYKILWQYQESCNVIIEEDNKEVIDLTKQQKEVLKLLVQGYKEKDIAEFLFISLRTVKYHKTNIFKKLKVQNSRQAVIKAVQRRII